MRVVSSSERHTRRVKVKRQSISEISAIQPLEPRQLLSCVIDVRLAGGGKAIDVTQVGQVVNMEVWAVITGSNATGSDDGFQSVAGSFLSTSSNSGAVLGNMSSVVLSPFTSSGAQSGVPADLDGDGDQDVGSNDFNDFPSFFNARAASVVTSGGVISGASQSLEIGTLSFTVSNLKAGQATDINFRERGDDSFTGGALWGEDGNFEDANSSSYSTGPSVVITDTSIQTQTESISGEVYNDANNNAKLDSGEAGVSGVIVYIDSNNNGVLDGSDPKTSTDTNGIYSFSGLSSGTYIVRQQVPSGSTQSAPSGGVGMHVTVSSGVNASNANFGDFAPKTTGGQSISGEVYSDTNSNGKLDSGETGISGVTVYIDSNNNSLIDANEPETTTVNGSYSFSGLAAGDYIVRQLLPSGDKQTAPSGGLGQHITVVNGSNVTGANFGDSVSVTNPVGQSISGEIYNDANSNSKLDSGETGLGGVVVYLDLNNNGALDGSDLKTTTDTNGNYSFSSLGAGAYIVRQTLPSGFKQITPSGGLGQHVTVVNGSNVTGANFGDASTSTTPPPAVSISGEVFTDTNGNAKLDSGETGVAGVVVYLDLNNDGVLDGSDLKTTTDVNGNYSFSSLAAGNYIVRQVGPGGTKQTLPTGGLGNHVTVATGKTVTGANFGDQSTTPATTGTITGEVFNDTNGNAKLDSGEKGLAGVVVYLDLTNNGTLDGSDPKTMTDANGNYSFTNLAPGNYIVRQVGPSGFKQSLPTGGLGNHVTVAATKTVTGANFGDQSTAKTAAVFSNALIQSVTDSTNLGLIGL
jgi:hypothetical protein